MSSEVPSILFCLATATLLGAAPASWGQEDCGPPLSAASIRRATVGVRAFPDRLAGGGPDYRLELTRDGVRFVPALGPRAPRVLPVEFALESVSVGGQELPIAAAGVEPAAEGNSLFYARGAGVTERYDLRRDGVEQSFVLAELPPQRGEVVVRGRLASELPLAFADERAGLLFAEPDLGGVRIGGVVGVDAAGRSAPGRMLLSGDRLELRLPAEFVAGAALPLTVDPLITAEIPINTGGPDDGEVDVGYVSQGGYLVVWTRTFAGGDTEIRGQRLLADTALTGGLLMISSSDENTHPAVGRIDGAEVFVVAWEHRSAAAPDSDVYAASVDDLGVISAETPVGATGADEGQPDAGRDWGGCPVVWRELGAGLRSASVTLDVFGDPTVNNIHTVTTGASDRNPVLGTPNTGSYSLLVWNTGLGLSDQIKAQRLIGATPISYPVLTIQSSLEPLGAPRCAAADDDDFMVVWSVEEFAFAIAPSHDIVGARVLFPGGEGQVQPAFAIESGSGDDERSPAIAYSKYGYLVAFLDENGLDDDLFAKTIDAMTGEILEEFTLDTHGTFSAPALFGRAKIYDHDPVDDVLAVYAEVDPVAGGDVLAALADGVGGTQEDVLFTGCPGTGDPRASAARSPNAKHRHELWNAEPGAACILGIGWAEDQIDLGAGTLVPDLEQMIAVFAGTADVNGFIGTKVPIPAGLAGSTFWFQWAVIPSAAACTSLGIDLADAIEIAVE